jgi:hypothetical protein
MLVPVRPGRYRAREPEHLAPQFDKFRDAVESLKGRFSVGTGHHAPFDQAGALPNSQSPKITQGQGGDAYVVRQPFPAP